MDVITGKRNWNSLVYFPPSLTLTHFIIQPNFTDPATAAHHWTFYWFTVSKDILNIQNFKSVSCMFFVKIKCKLCVLVLYAVRALVCSVMNHSERSVLLKGRRNRGDPSDGLQFGIVISCNTPGYIKLCECVHEEHTQIQGSARNEFFSLVCRLVFVLILPLCIFVRGWMEQNLMIL